MIQIDQQQKLLPNFLKEYGRLYFDDLDAIRDQITIQFTQRSLHQNLSAFFLDNMKENPSVYLLSWKESETSKTLLIKQAQERQWSKINMNYFPQRLAITDGHAFLFGANEVIIIGLQTKRAKSVKLEDGTLIDLKLCYSENKEPGVYVLYFNQKVGYYSKEYSKSSQISFWGQLKTIFHVITPKKYEKHEFFNIIFANLIGISLKDKVLIIYDMNTITATSLQLHFQTQITRSPVIRWTLNKQNKGLNEELHIFILVKNRIFHYVLRIARLQSNQMDISIQSIARGKVIDWEKCAFEKGELQIVSQLQITDFQVNSQELIYRQVSGNISEIPIIQRISLKDCQKKPSIISQQSSLWYQYFRYPDNTAHFLNHFKHQIPMQKQVGKTSSGKKILNIDKDSLHYLNKWRQNNQFKGFLSYNNQFYIFRNNGIRAFEVISALQYKVRNYGEAERLRDEQLKLGNLITQSKLIDIVNQYQILQEYQSIVTSIKVAAQLICNFDSPNNKITYLPSKSQLFVNLLRDRVDYYDQIIHSVYQELKQEQKTYKNSQIVRFIKYLKSCFFNTKLQSSIFEHNFIIFFVEKISDSLQQDNQFNITLFFKKILKNLLSAGFIGKQVPPKSTTSNEYLDFLIQFMMLSKDEDLTYIVQTELKKLIACVYPEFSDKTQPYLLRNISFVKVYFLSHPKDDELLSFCHKLINVPCYRQVAESLKQIFRLIPNQMDVLIKAELFLKKNSVSSCIFTTSSLVNLSKNEQLQIRGLSEQASRILIAECKPSAEDTNIDQYLNTIKYYYEELLAAGLSNYAQIQNKILNLYQERYKFEAANQNYANILEIEEIMLTSLSKLFNHNFDRAGIQVTSLTFFQLTMVRLLNQLEISFVSFQKYFKKLYDLKKGEVVGGINLQCISRRINEEESLMSSEFLAQPIKIKHNYVSSSLIQTLKNIMNSQPLLRLSLKHQLNFNADELTDQILKEIFSANSINNCEADILYFILLKRGERYVRRVLSKVALSAPEKIMNYFDRAEDRDVLYEMAENIVRFDKRLRNQALFA